MNQKTLSSFLTSMYEDRNLFIDVNGLSNTMNEKYMLVADALSENIELLSEVIKEEINLNLNRLNKIDNINIERVAF